MVHARTYPLVAAIGLAGLLLTPLLPVSAYAAPPGTTIHVVQPGETLGAIADSLGVDTDSLVRLNNLDTPDLLSVGQALSVPASATPAAAAARPSGGTTYTVVDGDTLWGIAQHFNTTPDALLGVNSLDNPNALSIGMQLSVPAAATAATTMRPVGAPPGSYTVQSGDTLYALARQFDLSLSALAAANNLDDPNHLSVGAVLTLPGKTAAPAPPAAQPPASAPTPAPAPRVSAARQHVVRVGETLKDIAAQEKVDLGALIDVNNLEDPELIHVGQVVVLPPTPGQTTPSAAADARPGTLSMASVPEPSAAPPRPAPSPAASGRSTTTPPPKPQAAAAAAAPGPGGSPKPAGAPPAAPAPTAPKPAASASAPIGPPNQALADAALKFQGARYVFGGSSPAGFDCSGLVWYVARQQGKPISRGLQGEYNSGPHPARDELKPGDLVFFQNTYMPGLSHNGIYIGNNKFVNAADEKSGVTISDMGSAYWSSHWFGATRLSS